MVVQPKFVEILKGYMPQSEVYLIQGSGHDLTLSNPTEVGNAVVKHLSG
jgi:pimeloyl-ACP methyl ester carboxylesterase